MSDYLVLHWGNLDSSFSQELNCRSVEEFFKLMVRWLYFGSVGCALYSVPCKNQSSMVKDSVRSTTMLSHGSRVQNRQAVAPCDIEQIVFRKSLQTCAVMCKWTDKKIKTGGG